MANMHRYAARDCWRVVFNLNVAGRRVRRAKYAKKRPDAVLLRRSLERVESATRTGLASADEIIDWINRGWIKTEEAAQTFVGFSIDIVRRREADHIATANLQQMIDAYEEYALDNSKANNPGRPAHKNHMSLANRVKNWLEAEHPLLTDLDAEIVEHRLQELRQEGYSEWSVYHWHTKLRLLLDQAVRLNFIRANPARMVKIGQPTRRETRRILTVQEAQRLLNVSLSHRGYMSGCLPTVVRMGLYAGMRNEEMCWLRWDAIDWANRILAVQESTCEETGEVWMPKTNEARCLDVKTELMDYLHTEQQRLTEEKILSPFVIPGGHWKKTQYRKRPLEAKVPSKSFAKMIAAEKMDSSITVYSLRHTYATMALWEGVDLSTLQHRMGHGDIRTTREYLHFIEPEQHPMDVLPY